MMFEIFANKDGKRQFAPKECRSVMPQAEMRQIDALKGRIPSTNYAWWNIKKGGLPH